MEHILIACPDPTICSEFSACLKPDYTVQAAGSYNECLQAFKKQKFDLTVIDISFLAGKAEQSMQHYRMELQRFWQVYPTAQLVALAPQEKTREAVNVVRAGAANYITYPLDPTEVRFLVEDTYDSLLQQSELDYLRDQFWHDEALGLIRTDSPAMKDVLNKVKSVAPTKTTVLLTGETGTGKGLIARLIHRHSNRYENQFISLHCGAIPDTLIESELFGHEKGSFTGAVRRKLGKFEIAKGGTIFLDEIGTVTPAVQIKLLQVLQEKTYTRIGGEEAIESEARVIAATNDDLVKKCEEGQFRQDLFYRLSVFPIHVPPLRERREDIPFLTETFLKQLNKNYLKSISNIHPQVMKAFEEYPWPGNIRELENVVERAYILESSTILTPESFPLELFETDTTTSPVALDTSQTLREVRRRAIETIERSYLKELLAACRGRINACARAAGITTRQLHKLLSRHKIRKEDYKL